MPRPREFNEATVLDAAVQCFWSRGYEATSVRDLIEKTGLTGASLYNAFGDKRCFYQRALEHYIDVGIAARIRRCEAMTPREGIILFFDEIVKRSLEDPDHKGCMLVNAALDVVPHDPGLQKLVSGALAEIEAFFLRSVSAGQSDGTIKSSLPAKDLSSHLLGILIGVRVLARVWADQKRLEGAIRPAMALLDHPGDRA
ncbi:MAG: TetR/AcrR family transcriptional regulator [Hyphomicrobium sp.]|jgi:TetR/AcrR family transcriptional repressor of nem operon